MPCRYQGHSSAKNIDANHLGEREREKERERERERERGRERRARWKLGNDWMDSRQQQQKKH